jgi:hypothetical protein
LDRDYYAVLFARRGTTAVGAQNWRTTGAITEVVVVSA